MSGTEADRAWTELEDELGRWGAAGRTPTLWWRDDDATSWTPALERLVACAQAARAPLMLAVIPAGHEPALARHLQSSEGLRVLQHGYSHCNHAAPGEKRAELAAGRDPTEVDGELRRGFEGLASFYGGQLAPVLVPPWNRVDHEVLRRAPGLGYAAVSTFTARAGHTRVEGLCRVNCHVDVINWRVRAFAGAPAVLGSLTAHLKGRRESEADPDEETGMLTHHLVHDDDCWMFLDELITVTRGAVRWVEPDWGVEGGTR